MAAGGFATHSPSPYLTAKATFNAITRTYTYLTPDLWKASEIRKDPILVRLWVGASCHLRLTTLPPLQEHAHYLKDKHKKQ